MLDTTPTPVLREPAAIAEAPLELLVATYNALTGAAVEGFKSRALGERLVEAAMLSNKDADGHLGVPKNHEPAVRTLAELQAKAAAKGVTLEAADDDADADAPAPVSTFGAMAAQLAQAAARAPAAPRARAPAAPARPALTAVKATGAGTSKVQAASVRAAVLAFIQAQPGGRATVAAIDAHFKTNTRGHLQKLMKKNHITPDETAPNPGAPE